MPCGVRPRTCGRGRADRVVFTATTPGVTRSAISAKELPSGAMGPRTEGAREVVPPCAQLIFVQSMPDAKRTPAEKLTAAAAAKRKREKREAMCLNPVNAVRAVCGKTQT